MTSREKYVYKHEATKPVHCTHKGSCMIRMQNWGALTYPSEGPVLAGHLNEVSDSGLIQTNRGGLVSFPGSLATSCPCCSGNGPGWHRPRISTQSTHCCLCGKAITLTPSFPSLRARSLWQEKRLWHLERCLYVWLCVGAAVRAARSGWWDAGKSTPPLHPLRITAVYVDMGGFMQIVYLLNGQTQPLPQLDCIIWPKTR